MTQINGHTGKKSLACNMVVSFTDSCGVTYSRSTAPTENTRFYSAVKLEFGKCFGDPLTLGINAMPIFYNEFLDKIRKLHCS